MAVLQKYRLKYALRLVLLFGTLFITLWLGVKGFTGWAVAACFFAVVQGYLLYQLIIIPFRELDDFAEAVKYRDFSRHFNVNSAPAALQVLRKNFNVINQTFKLITREKEAQNQYLQKILELIQTGILLYEEGTGKVIWANEALKKLIALPYIPHLKILEKKNTSLYNALKELTPGTGSVLLLEAEQMKVMLSATVFQTEGNNYKLIAFQNINEALDENEAQSWQKLLSVMTHEIMNSVAPIASLAETLKQQLQTGPKINASLKADVELGIETIQRRSEGLLRFAASYRTLNKITRSYKQDILLGDLFEHILQLLAPRLEQRNIMMETILKDPLIKITADRHLIEQVLINLMLNAIDAVKEKEIPKIILSAYKNNDNKVIITVGDNGAGIEKEVLEKIFIPFFSTKASGSGIGLSLCKQIMLLHKGNIYAKSSPGKGTLFYLQF